MANAFARAVALVGYTVCVPTGVDAFIGAAIPTHLLTREALALYARKIKPNGVVAIHVTNWNLELASPNVLTRNGWTRKSLNIGDQITVEGALAKDGSKMANARVVTLANGKRVFAGSSGGDGGVTQ